MTKCHIGGCNSPVTIRLIFNPGTAGEYVKHYCEEHGVSIVPNYRGWPIRLVNIKREEQ